MPVDLQRGRSIRQEQDNRNRSEENTDTGAAGADRRIEENYVIDIMCGADGFDLSRALKSSMNSPNEFIYIKQRRLGANDWNVLDSRICEGCIGNARRYTTCEAIVGSIK